MNPESVSITHPPTKPSCAAGHKKSTSRPIHNLVIMDKPSTNEKSKDERMGNRGSGTRTKCINEHKESAIIFFERKECLSASDFVKKHNAPCEFIKYSCESKTTWRHPSAKEKCYN